MSFYGDDDDNAENNVDKNDDDDENSSRRGYKNDRNLSFCIFVYKQPNKSTRHAYTNLTFNICDLN